MKKKAFQLYSDSRIAVDALSDEEAGQLIKAVFAHEDGEEVALKGALKSTFLLISNQLDRDRERYEDMCARNSKNGSKGGRPSAGDENPDEPGQTGANPDEPAQTQTNPRKPGRNPKKPIRIRTRIQRQRKIRRRRRKVSLFAALRPAHTPLLPRPFSKSRLWTR